MELDGHGVGVCALGGTVVQPGTLPMATGMVPAPEERVEEEDEEEDETERREKLRIIQVRFRGCGRGPQVFFCSVAMAAGIRTLGGGRRFA